MKSAQEGYCKLTGKYGKFIDAHILPKALTRPSRKGAPLYQMGEGSPIVRRWSSWYDPRLVIAEGERYLTDLDTWGIRNLRAHKLVWSGWGASTSVAEHVTSLSGSIGMRIIKGIDPLKLRLFFLSLLWRAAASELPEFAEVSVSEEDLEEMRRLIVEGVSGDLSFYPCQLTQLSSKGIVHNHAPIRDLKMIPPYGGLRSMPIGLPTFRFYFDGLIAHMHAAHPKDLPVTSLGNLIVGAEDSLVLSTVTYEDSLQALEIESVREEYDFE